MLCVLVIISNSGIIIIKINNRRPFQATRQHLPSDLSVVKDACDLTVSEL
jgi:hypothetical protein